MDDIATLLEPQIPALRRYAYALVRNHDVADDLVQDCLERAIARWYLRRGDGDLRAWLFTILRNRYISDFRQKRRRGTEVDIDAVALSIHPSQDDGLDTQDVLTALDRLSEEHKTVLLLVGVEDLSYEETANILGIPRGTVMSRLARARQSLRGLLDRGGATWLRRVK
ncbi:RNA polymerase sigma factor [Chelatococcus asaccharovorans]|uniref:RNA polymerase sigma-70 factor (ECF subfamily) n=1 Tax=Chelatococcus asaccharovorans TaxID=28210 RepID=A0A2V3TXC8_9HYPH|nr:sigma-70 family RNA polymerase sigma factor [Chelatococcus asaccharovorans]MBS7706838.1 sigma-70 family RNA polymerase sigma factor [Chelatococcus asaccharovorans]PXW54016.1 RNA polymerase sigma-70 factor (ECF subfamily) [Chelatococcus asaccharovorans]